VEGNRKGVNESKITEKKIITKAHGGTKKYGTKTRNPLDMM
jgi:hypothetical protein